MWEHLWESVEMSNQDSPLPEPETGDWVNFDSIDTGVGFSACSTYQSLEETVLDEGWFATVHGAVALSGSVLTTPFLRGQRARVLAFRDELPCYECYAASRWEPGVMTAYVFDHEAQNSCLEHWQLVDRERAENGGLEVIESQTILDALAERYQVPLLSLSDLQRIAHA